MVEALIDRLIPPDANSPGARECGCGTFIDTQLAGGYGHSEALYMRPPFMPGTARQGSQSELSPSLIYRASLKALAAYVAKTQNGKTVASLGPDELDPLLSGLESGSIKLEGADGKAFFLLLLKDTREGFFSDPAYGGNRNMAAWKMIGFPGARYDLRDWVLRHNEPYPYGPVSIATLPA